MRGLIFLLALTAGCIERQPVAAIEACSSKRGLERCDCLFAEGLDQEPPMDEAVVQREAYHCARALVSQRAEAGR